MNIKYYQRVIEFLLIVLILAVLIIMTRIPADAFAIKLIYQGF